MLNITDEIIFLNKKMTVTDFAERYLEEGADIKKINDTIEVLIRKGQVKVPRLTQTKEEKIMEKVAKEEIIREAGVHAYAEEEHAKDRKHDVKTQDRQHYDKMTLEFPTYKEALDFSDWVKQEVRVKALVLTDDGIYQVMCLNITDLDVKKIKNRYNLTKAGNAVNNTVIKTQETLNDTIEFTAKKVLSPLTKATTAGIFGVVKSTIGFVARTGSGVVTSGAKAMRDTAHDLTTDPEILKAAKELIDTKDSVKRTISNKTGFSGGNGITLE